MKAAKAKSRNEKELAFTRAFSSFSVDDLDEAKEFYSQTLGLDVDKTKEGLDIRFEDGQNVFIYPKEDHEPATFTVLNLLVDDIREAVDKLTGLGVTFEQYTGEMKTDENGIMWGKEHDGGPNIAWLKDPAGNFISVIEEP